MKFGVVTKNTRVSPMVGYLFRRVLWFIPLVVGTLLTTFIIARIMPGGPFDAVGDRVLPASVRINLEKKYHLDWPVWKQFISYLIGDEVFSVSGGSRGVLRGDFGVSYRYRGYTVTDIIKHSLPISVQLGLLALAIGVGVGIPLGIIAAWHVNSLLDRLATTFAVIGASVPTMVTGPLLIWIFALTLKWLPPGLWGAEPPFFLGFLPYPDLQFWKHAILPACALSFSITAVLARLTRASLLQAIGEEYIKTARAKGVSETTVCLKHAMRNSLIPIVTVIGPIAANVLTGTVVTEQVFGIPGMGKYFVESVVNRDYTVLLGVTLIFSFFIIAANLLVDILYALIDPRISYA
ncbi:MAG: ABC transporter permease [Candidatus Hadarchaeum sp.]|uniref:ABC transporter permease n=1 Tax=Candidatus Hadarchaeum sp. TaxID=2883567 RepID=UPI0031794266